MWPQIVLLLITSQVLCEDQCPWGTYGENCDKDCPLTCNTDRVRNLRRCQKSTGKCSEGCVPGHHGDQCNKFCGGGCLEKTCNQGNGQCTFGCKRSYSGHYCNITSGPIESTTTQPTHLAAILVPVFLAIIVVAIILAVVVLRRRKTKSRTNSKRGHTYPYISSDEALSLIEEQPEAWQFSSPRDEDIRKSHSYRDKLPTDRQYHKEDINDLFVETESFNLVKEKLKTFGHVTISGAPGEGKTSMALMLGAEYRSQGYELVLVEDVGTVQLSDCLGQGKDVCVIFDDIFQNVGSMDVHRLRQVLYELHGHLEQWRTMLETRYHILQKTPGAEQRSTDQPNLNIIFTTDTNNLEYAMSKLRGHILFQKASVVDLTKSKRSEEKKAIWLKHKTHYKCETDVDVNKIIAYDETVGFPLACKLFSMHTPFHKVKETFFEKPLFFLKRELGMNTSQLKDQSLKLLLKSLCDGEQELRQLQTESDNPELDAHLKDVLGLVSFSHPFIQDTFMSVLFNTKPELVLHNCSIKFICEHVHGQQHNSAHLEQNAIHFSDAYSDTIAARLAEAVVAGTFSKYIMHPMWKRKDIEDKVYQMLKDVGTMSSDSKHSVLHYASFSGNNDIIERLLPDCDINRRAVNGWTPAMFAVAGGQKNTLKLLVKHQTDITLRDTMNNDLFHFACQYGNIPIVECMERLLIQSTAWHVNSRGMNKWTPSMCAVCSGKNGLLNFLLKKKTTDLTLRDRNNNTVLHLACMYANESIVNSLLPLTDRDCQGENGMTPIMGALLSGRRDIFNLLMSHNADISLADDDNNSLLHLACLLDDIPQILLTDFDIDVPGSHGWTPVMKAAVNGAAHAFHLLVEAKADLYPKDDNSNNILHLACHGGHASIVKYLLTRFDINGRGNNGWTPVMYAAANGMKRVFDLLVAEGADLSLEDDNNSFLFHVASVGGNISIVEDLLPHSDINSRGDHGRTAVMNAAWSGQSHIFKFLESQNVDLELADDYKDTVLHFACEGGDAAIVEHLLPTVDLNSRGRNGRTPVMIAAQCGNRELFTLLVSKDVDLTLTDDYNNNILHLACQGGNRLIIEHLLPLFDINSQGQDGRTAVMYAAVNGLRSVFDLLVSNGADMSLKDDYNSSVFHLACLGGNNSIVEYLLQQSDINSLGYNKRSALMEAALAAKRNVFDLLVTKEADLNLIDDYNDNVLHFACQGGDTAIVAYLLKMFDVNIKGRNGFTPLMLAAWAGQKNVFNLLVSRNADLTLLDRHRNNLLHLACQGGNAFIIEYLMPLFDINSPGEDGWTPIMMSALSGNKDAYDLIASNGGIVSLITPKNDNVLHAASQGGTIAIMKKVIDLFDINTKGRNGSTPLMRAVIGGHISVLKFLMSRSADHTQVDNDGLTLLHLACKYGHLDVVKHISDKFDINTKDKAGLTCIMTSVLHGKVAVFEYLQSRGADLKLVDNTGDDALDLALKVDCKQIIEKLSSGGESDRNIMPWHDIMTSIVRSDVYHLNMYKANRS
ncbi:serine/threonine-protein phosphatase 6 regulatory ankyrin repeat subunit B-like [Haliotis cracherodii]|uniref:serine/threonine-protein phosphatase 6 regulatory ankyrin repeat subunit B-like n=1 Tax=Haliotis cracherodii TaxID=6455 RepID=UPI0039EB12AC